MSKKMKILLAIVAAVVVLTVGGGVAALAAGETTPPTTTTGTTPSNPLLAKVAAILTPITEQQLVEAFKQAREQVDKDAITAWLAKAFENKTITAEEKAAIEKWLAAKPDPANKDAMKAWFEAEPKISKQRLLNEILRAPGKTKQLMLGIDEDAVMRKVAAILKIDKQKLIDAFQKAAVALRSDQFFKALEQVKKNGKITQGEEDQIKSWWNQRPAAVDKLAPNVVPGMGGRVRGGMMRCPPRLPGAMAR